MTGLRVLVTGGKDGDTPWPGDEHWRIDAPHYVAAMSGYRGRVLDAAPIIKWARGKRVDEAIAYFRRKGFKANRIPSPPQGRDE